MKKRTELKSVASKAGFSSIIWNIVGTAKITVQRSRSMIWRDWAASNCFMTMMVPPR
ncbi:hypothetical protein D3C72_792580 [compost metagenome]